MAHPLQAALAVAFIIVGLSHVLCGRRWQAFFEPIFKSPGGPFCIAMYTLPVGLLIVFTHNVWSWDLGVIVTLYGWGSILKGTIYFLFPALPQKLITERIRSSRSFTQAGGVVLGLGLVLAFDCLFRA
jgi:uncharacterized protein YjeT (DUF2065 family)